MTLFYENSFLICKGREYFSPSPGNQIVFFNSVGTEYLNLINNLSVIKNSISYVLFKNMDKHLSFLNSTDKQDDLKSFLETTLDSILLELHEKYFFCWFIKKLLKRDLFDLLIFIPRHKSDSVTKQDLLNHYNSIDEYFIKISNSINYLTNSELMKSLPTIPTILSDYFSDFSFFSEMPRYTIYNEPITKDYEIIDDNSFPKETVCSYEINSIFDFISVNIKFLQDHKIRIKKCKNCGKYFFPHNKQVFCDNPSPQNNFYTCRNLPNDIKKINDTIYYIYRSNYKTQCSKKNRNRQNDSKIYDKFDKWNLSAKEKMEECKSGKITIDEYRNWFKKNIKWNKS